MKTNDEIEAILATLIDKINRAEANAADARSSSRANAELLKSYTTRLIGPAEETPSELHERIKTETAEALEVETTKSVLDEAISILETAGITLKKRLTAIRNGK